MRYPQPDAVFPADGGRVAFRPPAICQATGSILDPKTAFDSSGLELSDYLNIIFICDVTDDVAGRVKGKILDFLSLLASPGKAAVSNWNKAEEWHESCLGYL